MEHIFFVNENNEILVGNTQVADYSWEYLGDETCDLVEETVKVTRRATLDDVVRVLDDIVEQVYVIDKDGGPVRAYIIHEHKMVDAVKAMKEKT